MPPWPRSRPSLAPGRSSDLHRASPLRSGSTTMPVRVEARRELETQPARAGTSEPRTERGGIRDRGGGDLAPPLEHEGGGHVRRHRRAVALLLCACSAARHGSSGSRAGRARAPRRRRTTRSRGRPRRHGREGQRAVDEPDDVPDGVGPERVAERASDSTRDLSSWRRLALGEPGRRRGRAHPLARLPCS